MSTYRCAIGEKLLIRPETLSSPVDYEIIDIQSEAETVIASGTVTGDYVEITLASATYLSYRGKTLLLRLTDASANEEEALFVVSGLYDTRENLQKILGLLGENRKDTFSSWQEGNLLAAAIAIYESNAMFTERDSWDFERDYMTDFIPDWRFHVQHEKVTE